MRVITLMKKNELHNIDNYKEDLDVTVNDLIIAYSRIIIEYYKLIVDQQYTKFVILRGVDTITNVFNHMIYYTRNLELAVSYSEKSYLFYIEFVSQISDAEKLFLRLTSRDATMYVYNKTIADIKDIVSHKNNDNKRKFKGMKRNIDHELDEDKIFPYHKLPDGIEWCSYCLHKINDINCKFCEVKIHNSYILYNNYHFSLILLYLLILVYLNLLNLKNYYK